MAGAPSSRSGWSVPRFSPYDTAADVWDSPQCAFLLFAFFALCALLLTCWIPETKNLPLEEIESLFQKKLGGSQPSTVAAPRVLGVETENSDLLEQSPNSCDVSPATELRKTQPNSGKL